MSAKQHDSVVRSRTGRPPADFSARAQILAGAAQAFGEHGYAGTSVQHILDAAGVSRRTFYRCFHGKKAVFGEIFTQGVTIVLDLIRSAIAAADTPAAKLEAGVEAYLGARMALGPLARVLLTEQFPVGSVFYRQREQAVEAFAQLIDAEYRGGVGRPVDPLLVRALVAGMDYVAVQVVAAGPAETWELERAKRVMLRMLAASLAAPGEPLPPLPLAE